MTTTQRRIGLRCVAALVALCVQGTAMVVTAAEIPYKASSIADDGLLARAIIVFAVAATVVVALAWCAKRYMPSWTRQMRREQQLERMESLKLNTRSMLVRVRWGNQELLLGESESGVALIASRMLDMPATTMERSSHEHA
jgi:flagellar biogenesis protein FliO